MRRFLLYRMEDESGVSGTGTVAEGIEFSDRRCAMRWMSSVASTAVYDSLEELEAIHGHQGKTVIRWVDDDARWDVSHIMCGKCGLEWQATHEEGAKYAECPGCGHRIGLV